MAVRTSTQTGNTHNSPFAFASAVNDGDTLLWGNSAHTVTVDGDLTVGISPPQCLTTVPTVNATGGGAAGGSLAAGTYRVSVVNVDAAGQESSDVVISATFTVSAGNIPRVTMPALASGVSSRKLFLTDTNAPTASRKLYLTGNTTTTADLASASWTDGTTTFAAAAAPVNPLAMNITGPLVIRQTLTIRGDVIQGNVAVTIDGTDGNGAAGWEWDASAAQSTANAAYIWFQGTASNQTTQQIATANTSKTVRGFIRSNAGGANGRVRAGIGVGAVGDFIDSQTWNVTGIDFLRVGTASLNAIRLTTNATGRTYRWLECRFDACGSIEPTSNIQSNSTFEFINNTTINEVGVFTATICPLVIRANTAIGTGSRLIQGNVFTAAPWFLSRTDFTIGESVKGDGKGNVFYGGVSVSGTTGNAAAIRGNLYRTIDANDEQTAVSTIVQRNYFLADFAGANPHILGSDSIAATHTISENVFEYTGTDDNGDSVLHLSLGQIYEITNNIVTKNGDGSGATGTLITSGAGVASQKIRARHNTAWVASQSMISYAEGASPLADQIDEAKSNLAVQIPGSTPGSNGSFVAIDIFASGVTDVLTPADACNNCLAGTPGSGGTGVVGNIYKGTFSTPPGANDVLLADAAAVGFVNGDARIAEWDTSLGGTGTRAQKIANALAELMKRNDPAGYNAAYNVNALLDYVFAGHAPQNEALRDAGHDAVTIGAVEMAAAGGAVPALDQGMLTGGLSTLSGGLI
jgi:hypothetical protein